MGASFPLQSLSLFDRICFARASISVRICRSFRESFGLSHGLVGSLSLFVMLSSVTFPGQSGCLGRLLSDSLSTALCRHHLTGVPSLVVCLDSGCGNYEQMWLTTSLRGMLLGELRVKVLTEGVHSGTASGVVPSSFRIIRELLDRIEDSKTGKILVKEAYVDIPEKYRKYAQQAAETIGDQYLEAFPWAGSTKPMGGDLTELILNASWRPTISYTGIDGIPSCAQAGNVLRPETAIRLSIRLPPTLPVEPLVEVLPKILTKDPPYGAEVSFKIVKANKGWCAPPMEHWLEEAVDNASKTFFGKGARLVGEGGSIPFMGMLGSRYPGTQFVVTGVLGPHSNAHGPNEFLHIGMFKNLTCCVSYILAQHYKHVVVAGKSCTEAAESASLPQ